ncbi:MAG: hypothetical protein LBH55_00655 [Mycoplasmataceae bacterium]|jgi:hypothetical protein|nr:hypothetical protein [Mycoplasmataceae bacterium]
MSKRIELDGQTFGRYFVDKYLGYDAKKRGAFYKCIDMTDGSFIQLELII